MQPSSFPPFSFFHILNHSLIPLSSVQGVSKNKTCQQMQMEVGPYKVVVREDALIEVKAKFRGAYDHTATLPRC